MTAKTPLRTRRIPQRTCIGCGAVAPKRGLIRIVRTPDGRVLPDPTGKMAGRGAYLCARKECWTQALKRGRLGRSFRTKPSDEDVAALRSFAEGLELAAGGAE